MPKAEPHAEHSDVAQGLLGGDELALLLLSSTGEGVYGIDTEGKCTTNNGVRIARMWNTKLTGWNRPNSVLS